MPFPIIPAIKGERSMQEQHSRALNIILVCAVLAILISIASSGCSTTKTPSSSAYPITSPLDPATHEVINVSR